MIDRFELLTQSCEAPQCPACRLQMRWFRSVRMTDPSTGITHFFQCPGCALMQEKTIKLAVARAGNPASPLSPQMSRLSEVQP